MITLSFRMLFPCQESSEGLVNDLGAPISTPGTQSGAV